MSIVVNTLLEWLNESNVGNIERVLWISSSGKDIVTIEINNPKALPKWQKLIDIEEAIKFGFILILQSDPYARNVSLLNPISSKYQDYRDKAWSIIAPIIEMDDGKAFIPSLRGSLISEVSQRTGCSKKTIYKYLRSYWQGGQTKNALLPSFERCGGKGLEHQSSERKRGRPRKLSLTTQRPIGVNVNEEIREKFRRGIKLFYLNRKEATLTSAFQLTLEKFFHCGYTSHNGVLVPVLPPIDELPTLAQFRYWYFKERSISHEICTRKGERRFNLDYRAVTGNSTKMAFGPGSIYQIDATIGDVYLVSSLDRSRIIGRPVIYFIIDVFSRLITGFSVSLEGPSFLGAMLALENATADKVSFCSTYGITITDFDWPSHHLPETILADRGELEGYNADNLVNSLNIKVSNTPPYRADWKGIIERHFHTCNEKMIRWIPGAVQKPHDRGDKDYRLDAVLDLHQFRKLMIICILDHNKNHRMDWYQMDEFMITDHVEPYPIELWKWGIQNRNGYLRTLSPEIVRLNLLPTATASVTPKGIYFQSKYYTCAKATEQQWFVKARVSGRWKIKIAFDPRNLDNIYLHDDTDKQLITLHLIDSNQTFKSRDWYETTDYFELKNIEKYVAQTDLIQSQAEFHATIESIVKEASEQTSQYKTPNNHHRVELIRENRRTERDYERSKEYWDLEESLAEESPSNLSTFETCEYIAPPKPIEKLRKLRSKKLEL